MWVAMQARQVIARKAIVAAVALVGWRRAKRSPTIEAGLGADGRLLRRPDCWASCVSPTYGFRDALPRFSLRARLPAQLGRGPRLVLDDEVVEAAGLAAFHARLLVQRVLRHRLERMPLLA